MFLFAIFVKYVFWEKMCRLSVIVVNYKNPDRTIRFVREECPKIMMEHSVIVVDNGSGPDMVARLRDELADVAIIVSNPENEGFARANNRGAQYALEHFSPSFLLFVNNDIVFTNADVVDALASKLQILPNVGMIGPKVVGLDGRFQSPDPFRSFAELHLLPYWGKFFFSKIKLRRYLHQDYAQTAKEGYHYRIMGAFMLMNASDFVNCGMMDPHTFLYSEEPILSERLKRIGKRVWYDPSVCVLHDHGATINSYFNIIQRRKLRLESDSYYFKTYLSLSIFQYWLARFTYWIKYIFGL